MAYYRSIAGVFAHIRHNRQVLEDAVLADAFGELRKISQVFAGVVGMSCYLVYGNVYDGCISTKVIHWVAPFFVYVAAANSGVVRLGRYTPG